MPYTKSKELEKVGEEKFSADESAEREKLSQVENNSTECQSLTESSVLLNRLGSTSTENELIDLDAVELSDEDTWLYTSPKDLTKEEKGLSPYKWLRKDVEDPTNRQLQMAKTALVSKLDELDILGYKPYNKLSSKNEPAILEAAKTDCHPLMDFISDQFAEDNADTVKELKAGTDVLSKNESKVVLDSEDKYEKGKLKDVSDVLERARLQEESLKLSSSKFFHDAVRTFPRGNRSSSSVLTSNLMKPASIEALHAYSGRQISASSSINIGPKEFLQSSPNQSPFGSSASLNFPNDLHRSSLPNLNKGYNSLKLKKPKRTSESQIQCPLPIYPRAGMNASVKPEITHVSTAKNALRSPVNMHRESQTLPSSYRTRSRNNLVNKIEPLNSSSRRRDSSPSPLCQRTNLIVHPFRRESSPCIAQQSPRKMSGKFTIHGASMQVLQNTRSLSVSQLSPESDSDRHRGEHSRNSFSKRLPLSSVHNCSLKQEDYPVIHNNGELRKSSLPSKIPSPSNRSGIPVPSAHCAVDRSSPNKESWSQDFY